MRKDILRKLRALPATKEMMLKGKKFTEETERLWTGKPRKVIIPEYDVLFRVQNLSGYIKVAIFLPEDMRNDVRTPRYELFINKQGHEYITRELDESGEEVRWLTSMINNLPDVCIVYWRRQKEFISKDGRNTLNRLKTDKKDIRASLCILRWQQQIRKEKIEQQEKKEQLPWDADMKLIPKEPPTFREWMRKEAARDVYIIYKYDPKGAKTGYCSSCKKTVPISAARHNKKTVCPACKKAAVFKADSRIKTLCTEKYYAEMIQKINGGIVIRGYSQYQGYSHEDYKSPHISTREDERTLILEDGTVKRYVYGSYKNKYNRWIPDEDYIPGNRTYYWSVSIALYKKNFHTIKKIPMIQKSSLNCWDELPTSITDYLAVEKKHPVIEKLVKAGLFKLAKECMKNYVDMTKLNHKETELAKILRIDNARLKRLKNLDGGDVGLRWLQYEKAVNKIWPDEMIRDFDANELLSSSFGFISAPISYVKCWNYLKKQAAIMDESLKQALITWRDYVNMADQLGMNTALDQILKPKDVKKAHDELIILKQKEGMQKTAREIEKKWPKVNKQLQKLKKFEFTKGEYCIIAPESIFDIVKEGTTLRHCVHTCDYYFDRISRDESYLFFLRQKSRPDIPWYTLEVEPNGNIRQKRTTGDNQNADFQKAVVFLKHWQQFFKQQLTEKEQELGEKADKLRKTNYAKLRKDGNRVWHGKLAGQLLADVLEKDFMEA